LETPIENLSLQFTEPDEVNFIRGHSVSQKEWERLISFWGRGINYDLSKKYFTTNLEDYLTRRIWFKTEWRQKSLIVELSESLKNAVQKSASDKQNFDNALGRKAHFQVIDLKIDNLKRQLTPEQLSNVTSSLAIENGANFSVPGAGKTMTTLTIWNHLVLTKGLEKLLVICPKSAFEAWSGLELKETFLSAPVEQIFSSEKIKIDTDILITNYEKLENNRQLKRLLQWVKKNRVMLVVDEAHRIKGGGQSVRWFACREIAKLSKRVELLTGTPMPQGLQDLRNLLKVGWTNLPSSYLTDTKLTSLVPGSVFVRTTKDQLNLPPFEQKEIIIEMSEVQEQIYSALIRSYKGMFLLNTNTEKELARKGRAVMTLIAAASNPGLIAGKFAEDAYLNLSWPPIEISKDKDLMDLIQNYVSHEIPPKYEWILKFIKGAAKEKKKTIIWSSFVGNLRSMQRLLSKFNPALIYGGVSREERESEVYKFRYDNSCHVLLTNPQTLGEGISFHKQCHQAVYLDRTYNAGQYLQSLDRIHRLGLEPDILTKVFVLASKKSIDNKISVRLEDKISAMAKLLNDVSLKNAATLEYEDADEQIGTLNLDSIDLSDLYRHLAEND